MTKKPRLLDLFCGGGGGSMGYWLAGFDVVGVDIDRQARYPFSFFQADALEFVATYGSDFDAIHASPPCQAFSQLAGRWPDRDYPDLVTPLRPLLKAAGRPYIIENVEGAPLISPVVLQGEMFALGTEEYKLVRRRAFEMNWPLLQPTFSSDERDTITVTGHAGRAGRNGTGSSLERREAMGIPWLGAKDLPEAIPPAYTRYIGEHLLIYLAYTSARVVARREKLEADHLARKHIGGPHRLEFTARPTPPSGPAPSDAAHQRREAAESRVTELEEVLRVCGLLRNDLLKQLRRDGHGSPAFHVKDCPGCALLGEIPRGLSPEEPGPNECWRIGEPGC